MPTPAALALAPWLLLAGLAGPLPAELPPEVEEELDRLAEVFEQYDEFTATYAMRRDGEEGVMTIAFREEQGIVVTVGFEGRGAVTSSAIDGVMFVSSFPGDDAFWGSYDIGGRFEEFEVVLEALEGLGLEVEPLRPGPEVHLHFGADNIEVNVVWAEIAQPFCAFGQCRKRFAGGRVEESAVVLRSGPTTSRFSRAEEAGFLVSAIKEDTGNGIELIALEHEADPDWFVTEVPTDGREDHSAAMGEEMARVWRAVGRELIHSHLSEGLQEETLELTEAREAVRDVFELWYEPILTERYESWPDWISTSVVETADRIDEITDADARERQTEQLENETMEFLESKSQSLFGTLEGGWDHFREDDLLEIEAEAARNVFDRLVTEPVLVTLEEQVDRLLD